MVIRNGLGYRGYWNVNYVSGEVYIRQTLQSGTTCADSFPAGHALEACRSTTNTSTLDHVNNDVGGQRWPHGARNPARRK
jgi:hypothetical protein